VGEEASLERGTGADEGTGAAETERFGRSGEALGERDRTCAQRSSRRPTPPDRGAHHARRGHPHSSARHLMTMSSGPSRPPPRLPMIRRAGLRPLIVPDPERRTFQIGPTISNATRRSPAGETILANPMRQMNSLLPTERLTSNEAN
jgi:hypothetical protein